MLIPHMHKALFVNGNELIPQNLMTSIQYLKNVIAAKKAPNIELNDSRLTNIKSVINEWAGGQLVSIKKSGSSAKGTAVHGIADFDIFISLKSNTTQTLKELYNLLDTFVSSKGYVTKRQNVALGITVSDLKVDLVPGKIQEGYQNYHSIYSSKNDTWMQTNIDLHISKVVNSSRQEEIILTKIWKNIHGLKFLGIYVELTVLEALKGKAYGDITNNFLRVLEYLRDNFVNATVIDPANTNNKISEMLTLQEKHLVSSQARVSRSQTNWEQIIW